MPQILTFNYGVFVSFLWEFLVLRQFCGNFVAKNIFFYNALFFFFSSYILFVNVLRVFLNRFLHEMRITEMRKMKYICPRLVEQYKIKMCK